MILPQQMLSQFSDDVVNIAHCVADCRVYSFSAKFVCHCLLTQFSGSSNAAVTDNSIRSSLYLYNSQSGH